ncbi:MAG: stage II sporulation protein R [Oscillospiraceae bacterium]|nr:stage II sporulation protein R [Oscillospiraceae bacterium]
MKRFMSVILVFLLGIFSVRIADTAQALRDVENSVLRLHILAASDSSADQTNKLLVRDALLAQSAVWNRGCSNRAEMEETLVAHLPMIEQIAEQTLRENACDDPVTASICKMDFPQRQYGDITLPAGEYEALCLVIGEGEGQNWWCVMYPSICVQSASAPTDAVPSEMMGELLNDDACALVTDTESYEVRLKCVELFRAIADWVTETLSQWHEKSTADKTSAVDIGISE